MIPTSIIFSTIALYYECCNSRRKKDEREWEVTLNQRESPHSLTLVMYGMLKTNQIQLKLTYGETGKWRARGKTYFSQNCHPFLAAICYNSNFYLDIMNI